MFQNFRIHLTLEITYFGYCRIQTILIVFVKILENDQVGSNMQLRKENPCGPLLLVVKVSESKEITIKASIAIMRKPWVFFFSSSSSIQAYGGHWLVKFVGPLFILEPLVMTSKSLNGYAKNKYISHCIKIN